ncbi:hypothetical protein GVv1_41230 [Enterobacter pseudoroggenkampii]
MLNVANMRIDVVCLVPGGAALTQPTPPESKNPAEAGFSKKLKLTDKAASFNHTSGVYSAGVVVCRRLYRTLYCR